MPWWDAITSGLGDLFGGSSSGPSSWGDLTPFDATTVDNPVAADVFTSVPGLTSTPDILGGLGSLLGGGGGILSGFTGGGPGGGSPASTLGTVTQNPLARGVLSSVLGGGASGGVGGAATPSTGPVARRTDPPAVAPPAATPGGAPSTAPGGGPSSSGGGILGSIGNFLTNPGNLALIPALMQAINSKDQTNLGPDADALRAMATKNQGLADSLSGEASAERMGELPGPALAALSRSLEEQKAQFASSYDRMGMSGSSAEAADMAALNQQAESQRFQIGMNMSSEALNQVSGLNSQDATIYGELMQAQASRDAEYMAAMANLAKGIGSALAGPSTPTPTPAAPAAATGGPGASTPAQIAGATPLPADFLNTILPGVDPSTLITPQTSVPDLIPTPALLPDPSQVDPTTNPDSIAAGDFLSQFVGLPQT